MFLEHLERSVHWDLAFGFALVFPSAGFLSLSQLSHNIFPYITSILIFLLPCDIFMSSNACLLILNSSGNIVFYVSFLRLYFRKIFHQSNSLDSFIFVL